MSDAVTLKTGLHGTKLRQCTKLRNVFHQEMVTFVLSGYEINYLSQRAKQENTIQEFN